MADISTTETAPVTTGAAPVATQISVPSRETHTPRVMHVNVFLDGVILTLSMIAALLFIRIYRKGRERFYLFLAASFIVYGVNRIIFQFYFSASDDVKLLLYSIRFISFGLVFIGLFDKNLRRRSAANSSAS